MKKYMLLCTIGLMFMCADVGKATNVSQTAKTLIVPDNPCMIVQTLESLGVNYLVFIQNTAPELKEIVNIYTLPVFTAPAPLVSEIDLQGCYVLFRCKGQLKAKFHPWYLFNPVKTC